MKNLINWLKTISYLGFFNRFLFQWFFIRLTKCKEKRIENYNLDNFDLVSGGNMSSRGTGQIKIYQWYSFQFWVLPLTEWKNNFKYLNENPKFIRISKKILEKYYEEK